MVHPLLPTILEWMKKTSACPGIQTNFFKCIGLTIWLCRYSGVIRGQGAYVPPGARRALAIQTPPSAAAQAKPASTKANGAAVPAPSAVAPSENKAAPAALQQVSKPYCFVMLATDPCLLAIGPYYTCSSTACIHHSHSCQQRRPCWRVQEVCYQREGKACAEAVTT